MDISNKLNTKYDIEIVNMNIYISMNKLHRDYLPFSLYLKMSTS